MNVIDEQTFQKIKGHVQIQKSRTKLFPYGSDVPLNLLGKFSASVSNSKYYDVADFYVVKGKRSTGCLLVSDSATVLGILKIISAIAENSPKIVKKSRQANTGDPTIDRLVTRYDKLFHGIGKMKGVKVKLDIDDNVEPVAQKHRRVPFHLRAKVEQELKRLEDNKIIEKIKSSTGWVSPIVIAPKKDSDEIRICVDMVEPNRAIKRVRHLIPTVDELRFHINGATVFSKLDLASGFHQLELDEDSKDITTFSTHVGLRRYCRLNFGTNSAPEIFHEELRKKLEGISGAINIHNDIIIYGVDQEDHKRALKEVFQKLYELEVTLNWKKCMFNQSSIKFYGLIFSKEGISPDPEKVEALKHVTAPRNKKELRSFLGMTNYSAQFIPNYATLVDPLRALTRKNIRWSWTENHQECFDKLKEILKSNALLNYYDPSLPTEIVVDASPYGISCILAQYENGKNVPRVVSYHSRALNAVERRYGHIERESLAIMYGCERNQLYLLGSNFTVITDHKPLVSLYNNPKRPGPFRVERMRLRLQGFSFKVVYQKGKLNPSDFPSRQPKPLSMCTSDELNATKELEAHINWVMKEDVPPSISLNEIKAASKNDKVMQKLFQYLSVKQCSIDDPLLKPFRHVLNELSVIDGIIMRGSRIIVPKSLQNKVIQIGHEAHQGMVKTKQFLRSRVWFPQLDKMVSSAVGSCITCQTVVHSQSQEPIESTELPNGPWEKLDIDYYGPLPSGELILVVIDEYSRFPEVAITTSTSAKATLPALDRIMSSFGIPLTLKSDNGPPFQSKAFKDYCQFMGIEHVPVTPRHPRANGLVENFNKNIDKIICAATVEHKSWRQELYKFLRNYRATPHLSTGKSPAELLFQKRPFRSRLPELLPPKFNDREIREKDAQQKLKAKVYADDKPYVKRNSFQIGDTVLVKNEKKAKTLSFFEPKPYSIVKVKGSMITAKHSETNKFVTRNSSYFKKLKLSSSNIVDKDTYDLLSDDNDNQIETQVEVADGEIGGEGAVALQDDEVMHGGCGNNEVQEDSLREEHTGRPVRNRRPPQWLNDYDVNIS